MTDESFTSLFTFTAIELIAQLNLISSYSLIHMAKLWSVRVAIIMKFIIIEKIAKSRNRSMWHSFALTARRGLPAQRSACRGPCCTWLPCWWPLEAARGPGGPRRPTSADLCKFSSLKVLLDQQLLLLVLCSPALSRAAVAGSYSPRPSDFSQVPEAAGFPLHRSWSMILCAISAISCLSRHFGINFWVDQNYYNLKHLILCSSLASLTADYLELLGRSPKSGLVARCGTLQALYHCLLAAWRRLCWTGRVADWVDLTPWCSPSNTKCLLCVLQNAAVRSFLCLPVPLLLTVVYWRLNSPLAGGSWLVSPRSSLHFVLYFSNSTVYNFAWFVCLVLLYLIDYNYFNRLFQNYYTSCNIKYYQIQ